MYRAAKRMSHKMGGEGSHAVKQRSYRPRRRGGFSPRKGLGNIHRFGYFVTQRPQSAYCVHVVGQLCKEQDSADHIWQASCANRGTSESAFGFVWLFRMQTFFKSKRFSGQKRYDACRLAALITAWLLWRVASLIYFQQFQENFSKNHLRCCLLQQSSILRNASQASGIPKAQYEYR